MSTFDNRLRQLLEQHINSSEDTYYKVAKNTGISTQTIYRFRNEGGLNGENTLLLMEYLGVNREQLINSEQ